MCVCCHEKINDVITSMIVNLANKNFYDSPIANDSKMEVQQHLHDSITSMNTS